MSKQTYAILILILIISGCLHTGKRQTDEKRESKKIYMEALEAYVKKDYTVAAKLLKEIITRDADFYPAYGSLVNVYTAMEELDDAEIYFKNLSIKKNPHPPWALGMIYEKRGLYDRAIKFYKNAIDVDRTFLGSYEGLIDTSRKKGAAGKKALDDAEEYLKMLILLEPADGGAHYGLGYLLFGQRKYDEALQECLLALEGGSALPQTGNLIGSVYYYLSDYPRALEYFEKALSMAKKTGDTSRESKALNNIGNTYWSFSNYHGALEYFKKALSKAKELDDKKEEGIILNNIGIVYCTLSQYTQALDYYKQALNLAREVGNKMGEGRTLNSIGSIHANLSDYSKALEYLSKSLTIAKKLGDKRAEGNTLNITGMVYQSLSDYPRALEYFEEFLSTATEIGDKRGKANAFGGIGIVYKNLSDYPKALEYYKKALSIATEIGDKQGEGDAFSGIGNVYGNLSDYPKALEYHEKALSIKREIGDKMGEGKTMVNIGAVYESLSNYPGALNYYEKALSIAKKIGNREVEGKTISNMGHVYLSLSDYPGALECLENGLSIFRDINNKEGESTSLGVIGNVYLAQKEYHRALSFYREAITIAESIRDRFRNEEFKTQWFQTKVTVYENTIRCLYELHGQDPSMGFDRIAFTYAEKSKARGLLDLLTESRADIRQGIDPGLHEQERQLEKQYALVNTNLQKKLSIQSTRVDREKVSTLKAKLKTIDQGLEELKLKIIRNNPRYAELKYPGPVTVQQVRKSISNKKTLFIEYKVTGEAVFAWRITHEEFKLFKLDIKEENLSEKVLALRNCFTATLDEEAYIWRSSELYQLLMAPLLKNTGEEDTLLIVPDGVLNYLPFEALAVLPAESDSKPTYKEMPFLIRDYTIHYTQSAAVACNLIKKSGGLPGDEDIPGRSEELFALGDPLFLKEEHTGENSYIRNALPGIERGMLNRLIYSGEEVRSISRFFDHPAVYLREEAIEEQIKSPSIENYPYIHLAVHGILNEINPRFSGIVLTQDDDPGEDGFLLTREIFNIKLNADLVVLSACSTGLGKNVTGEGIVGFSRAWLYAGASSLVVSLWNINDLATSLLMKSFYKKIKEGAPFRRSLREAKLEIIEKSSPENNYAHPNFWAGFILLGGI